MATTVKAVNTDVYPYRYVRYEAKKKVGKKTFHLFAYGAYDAFGLIGPEDNGIAVGNVTDRQLCIDEHNKQGYGWYPGFEHEPSLAAQRAELERLATMSGKDFLAFLRSHPRYRHGSAD